MAHDGDGGVYGPAEDSALLATAVEADLHDAHLVLDVGTGTGYVGERVADATGARVIGTDINPMACQRAIEHGIEPVLGDLTAPFTRGAFDTVLFNPPYLPAVDDIELDWWFETAVSGGESGRAVIFRFLADVGRVLTLTGRAYLLVSSLTGRDEIVDRAESHGLTVAAIEADEYPEETLFVLRLTKSKSDGGDPPDHTKPQRE